MIAIKGEIVLQNNTERMQNIEIIAHELRTPLSNIIGYTEFLLENPIETSEREEYLNIILDESVQLSMILDDILDLAKIESNSNKSFQFRENEIICLLQESISVVQKTNTERYFIFESTQAQISLIFDNKKIKQVINNLLSNAIKYSFPKTQITVSVKEKFSGHTPGIIFSVSDHGIGMSDNEVEQIYDRFYRVNHHTKTHGSGLGMSIVKKIIDEHHGHITIDSLKGRGTKVSIWLPKDRRLDSSTNKR